MTESDLTSPKIFKNWYFLTLKGVLVFILGILFIFNPGNTLLAFVQVIGAFSIIAGILLLAGAFSQKSVNKNWSLWAMEGLADIILGVVLFSFPIATVLLFTYLLSFWFIFIGILQVVTSFLLKKEFSFWWLLLVGGVLTCLFGGLIMSNPFEGISFLTVVTGLFACAFGLLIFALSLLIKNIRRSDVIQEENKIYN